MISLLTRDPISTFGHRRRRAGLNQLQCLVDRQVQNFRDVLPVVVNLERLAVVTPPAAVLAGYIDIRQEMHFDSQQAAALAALAAPARQVE